VRVGFVVARAIAAMRCAGCGQIMRQGERERNPVTEDGRPIHERCAQQTKKEPSP